MAMALGDEVDTVIIGNGPSALILSYILHGNVPYYSGGHSDALLNRKLGEAPNVLNITPDTYNHIRSSISYSTQALPVNVLLDTLIRPKGDTTTGTQTCLEWRHEPDKAVTHLVIGNAPAPGGQWADNPVAASWDIGTLSYAEQLTLPGYSIGNHWRKVKNEKLPPLIRPTRRDIADYLAAYPAAVGIQDAFRTSTTVGNVTRTRNGFLVMPQGIKCKHLVLATGVFNINLPPPSFLARLSTASADDAPLLVIGSGFTAADIIISTPPTRKILHIFNWDPTHRPSPLKACHAMAYPDYAWIYRQMRMAGDRAVSRMIMAKDPKDEKVPDDAAPSIKQRDWKVTYEGYGNARIVASSLDVDFPQASTNHAPGGFSGRRKSSAPDPSRTLVVEIGRSSIGDSIRRNVGSFRYAVGRRGSLSYLSLPLFQEVVPESPFARRGSSISHDGLPLIPETARPRTSDGGSPNGVSSLSPTGRLMPVDNSDLRRSSFQLDPKRASILSVNRPRSSTHETLASATDSPGSSRGASHFALSAADPIMALRRGSAEIDFATEAKPTLKISGHTMRAKIEAGQEEAPFHGIGYQDEAAQSQGFEVAPDVFVIGSLTGDSLIRFAFGGCAVVAGKLMRDAGHLEPLPVSAVGEERTPAMNVPQFSVPSFNTIPPTPMALKNETKNAFDENFSFAGRTPPTANAEVIPRSDGPPQPQRRNPSVDGVDPHMYLAGQDHVTAENADLRARSLAAADGGSGDENRGSWLSRQSDRRASAAAGGPSLVVRAKESDKEVRRGSLFGKMKDKMAGR